MKMTDMKSQGRRTLADSFMRDAQREATPWRSRADLAFEAVYLYALAVLGEQADDYEHPDSQVLTAAAEKLTCRMRKLSPRWNIWSTGSTRPSPITAALTAC